MWEDEALALLTWMSSRSDRQSSVSTESRCPGALRVDLNLPPKIRVIGLSTALICFFLQIQVRVGNEGDLPCA